MLRFGNAVRIQMALQVIYGDKRLVGTPRRALRERKAHNERTHQAGSIRHGNSIEVTPAHASNAQRGCSRCQALIAHATDRLDMLATRDFGNHTAEARMEVNLRWQPHRQCKPPLPVDDDSPRFRRTTLSIARISGRVRMYQASNRGRLPLRRGGRGHRHWRAHLKFHTGNNGSLPTHHVQKHPTQAAGPS